MIPWLLVATLISNAGQPLSKLVEERMAAFPCSGEINYRVDDVPEALARVRNHFAPENPAIDQTDGVSLEFADWRFNLRSSNTEPLLRLNVETKGNAGAIDRLVATIETLIQGKP